MHRPYRVLVRGRFLDLDLDLDQRTSLTESLPAHTSWQAQFTEQRHLTSTRSSRSTNVDFPASGYKGRQRASRTSGRDSNDDAHSSNGFVLRVWGCVAAAGTSGSSTSTGS